MTSGGGGFFLTHTVYPHNRDGTGYLGHRVSDLDAGQVGSRVKALTG